MKSLKRGAFTLLEMLVVITIITMLASMVIVSFGKFKDKAREAQCLNNLKNVHGVAMLQSGEWLSDTTINVCGYDDYDDNNDEYVWRPGWIDRGEPITVRNSSKREWYDVGVASGYTESDGAYKCITNGWWYENHRSDDLKILMCPVFNLKVEDAGINDAMRSYVMNQALDGKSYSGIASGGIGFSRYLMFADMGITNMLDGTQICHRAVLVPQGEDISHDGILTVQRYSSSAYAYETIGIYHGNNKGNAIFMDGHIEQINWYQTTNACAGLW
ncbi:hypothetical protein BVX97_00120 [bacterium E08(2017)]|nr:hypothetical protein BVX97_00120 [bacterium E08(2017)]